MAKDRPTTGVERTVDPARLLVSKTDLTGKIVYFNDYFRELAGFTRAELMGAPHSIVRHPQTPRAIYKRMWARIANDKREMFAFIVNRCANGDHYWVVAHVTPSFNTKGQVTGYHSNRRATTPGVIKDVIAPLYAEMCAAEDAAANGEAALAAGETALDAFIAARGRDYDEVIVRMAYDAAMSGKAA
ncbi:MAG: PAS domain-containing protein [Pseudomonadota bacterium]